MTESHATSSQATIELQTLIESVLGGNRRGLARAITRVENTRPDGRSQAHQLVSQVLPHTGGAVRIGISGVPGVGKSTFIESFGLFLIEAGHRVAVLAIDPSSQISGGSIMGDKVRMERLARNEQAFIRPSPAAGSLGGVARRTRETMLLCEAAGYDVVLVETVGVGQSEITVAEMVDFFLVLMLPNAGDEIQGIKKGIVEMADGLVINKADGEFSKVAQQAQRYYQSALHLIRPRRKGWHAPVLKCSALHGEGMAEVWQMIHRHRDFLQKDDGLAKLRVEQMKAWFHAALHDEVMERLYRDPQMGRYIQKSLNAIQAKKVSPHQAAEDLVAKFLGRQ